MSNQPTAKGRSQQRSCSGPRSKSTSDLDLLQDLGSAVAYACRGALTIGAQAGQGALQLGQNVVSTMAKPLSPMPTAPTKGKKHERTPGRKHDTLMASHSKLSSGQQAATIHINTPSTRGGVPQENTIMDLYQSKRRIVRVASERHAPWVYQGRSFGAWHPSDEPRSSAILLIEHPAFDIVILSVILLNVVTMAWQSPLDPPDTVKAQICDTLEWVYLFAFTAEMLVKMCAFTLWSGHYCYFRDYWCLVSLQPRQTLGFAFSCVPQCLCLPCNHELWSIPAQQFDFVVVTLAWLPLLIPSMGSYTGLRALRALRTLRTLKFLQGMPMLGVPLCSHSCVHISTLRMHRAGMHMVC